MTSPGSDATAPSGTGGYPDALAVPAARVDLWSAPDFGDALAAPPAPVETLADADSLVVPTFEWAGDALAGPVAGADPLLGAAALAGEPPYPNALADTFTDFAVTTVPEPVVVMPPAAPPVAEPPPARQSKRARRRAERRARRQAAPPRRPAPGPADRSEWAPSHARTSGRPTVIRTPPPPTPEPPRGWGATYAPPPERAPVRPGRGAPTGTVPWRGQANRYRLRDAPDRRRRRKKSSVARIIFFAIVILLVVGTRIQSCVSDVTDDPRDRGAPAAPVDPGPAQR